MALLAKTKEQKTRIESLILCNGDLLCVSDEGVKLDGVITFDEMASVVDFLRNDSPQKELFEKCWVAYNRKGNKKKSLDYWKKLTDDERKIVLPHIKAYVSTREIKFQKDFERYLRDKIFLTIVFSNNKAIYDPSKILGMESENVYSPLCDGSISWNEYYNCFMYIGYWDGKNMPDGYLDENRPDGASITLNNGRGVVVWNSETKTWNRI